MASERDRTYRVGIIGTGLKGTQHAQAFAEHPAAEVVAGADTDAANLALFGERFAEQQACTPITTRCWRTRSWTSSAPSCRRE